MCTITFIKNNISLTKEDFFAIPHFDRLRISKLDETPEFDTGVKHLYARTIDRTHYLLSQLIVIDGCYVGYEYLYVTIHGYIDRNHYHYKTYRPLVKVWFK